MFRCLGKASILYMIFASFGLVHAEENTSQIVELRARAENSSFIVSKSRSLDKRLAPEAIASIEKAFTAYDSKNIFKVYEPIGAIYVARPAQEVDQILREAGFQDYEVLKNDLIYGFSSCEDDEDLEDIPVSPAPERAPRGVKRVIGPNPTYSGTERVWIVDSGIANDTVITNDLNIAGRIDCLSGSCSSNPSQTDTIGHGTMLAGIIGAKVDGNGFKGVAPNAIIMSVKIFEKGMAVNTLAAALDALTYIDSQSMVENDVINISWGAHFDPSAGSASGLVEDMLRTLEAKPAKIVIAAGNIDTLGGSGYVQAISPARAGNYRSSAGRIFTVSGVRSRRNMGNWIDTFWQFSGFGNGPPDFAAPAFNVKSYWPGAKINMCSGTSFSAAHVSGLLLTSTPNSTQSAELDPSALIPGRMPGSTNVADYEDAYKDPVAER